MRYLFYSLLFSFVTFSGLSQKICAKKDIEQVIQVDGGELKGSLLVPKSKKPIPVVLLIPGSGPTDRNCNSGLGLQSNAFIYIAEALYKEKIATLRVDKRVSGESMKTFNGEELVNVKFESFISDTEKWIQLLKQDGRFSDLIVAGHSQGSLVGMIAAKQIGAEKFISISGAGRSIDKVLFDQLNTSLPHLGDSTRMFLDSIKAGTYFNNAPILLRQTFPLYLKEFLNEWMSYDPAQIIAQLTIPSLIINGDNDIQVDVDEAKTLHEANPKAKLVILPGVNHVLKQAPTDRFGNIGTYNLPLLPVDQQVIDTMIEFIKD